MSIPSGPWPPRGRSGKVRSEITKAAQCFRGGLSRKNKRWPPVLDGPPCCCLCQSNHAAILADHCRRRNSMFCPRWSAARLFLRHPVLPHPTDRDQSEPLLAEQGQPGLEGSDCRVVRVADGDAAAMLPRDLLEPGELLGDRHRCLVVVEEYVAGGVWNPVGHREANPG